MQRRVGILGMWQETNTYSSRKTTLADFEAFELLEGETILTHHQGNGSVIGGFLDGLGQRLLPSVGQEPAPDLIGGARRADDGAPPSAPEVIPLLSAGAWPAAPPDADTTHQLLDRLESALRHAPALDGLLVNLHGAMVCDGASDMEAETLRRIRSRYPKIPLVAVLDLHANFSAEACARCDAVVGYRTYPHVDMADCGREATALLLRALAGETFVTAYAKLDRLTTPLAQNTAQEPMRGLLARAEARAAAAGADRVTLLPGFPYSDVARCGFCVLAVATDPDAALAVVRETLADVEAHLPDFVVTRPNAAEAVREALARPQKPVVLADIADNIGGGSPGDGTVLLAEFVAARAAGAVVIIADAEACERARAAGPGATLEFTLGGKSDRLHGEPITVTATVTRLGDGTYSAGGTWMTGQTFAMGPTAVLDLEAGPTVLLVSRATPPFHVEQLISNGIDPAAASIIVAKGAVAWRAAYESVMASAIEVDTPGCCPIDPHSLPRAHAPARVEPHLPARR